MQTWLLNLDFGRKERTDKKVLAFNPSECKWFISSLGKLKFSQKTNPSFQTGKTTTRMRPEPEPGLCTEQGDLAWCLRHGRSPFRKGLTFVFLKEPPPSERLKVTCNLVRKVDEGGRATQNYSQEILLTM